MRSQQTTRAPNCPQRTRLKNALQASVPYLERALDDRRELSARLLRALDEQPRQPLDLSSHCSTLQALGFQRAIEPHGVQSVLGGVVALSLKEIARALVGTRGPECLVKGLEATVPGLWMAEEGSDCVKRAHAAIAGHLQGFACTPELPGQLIESAFPPFLRKQLGEFYTPRWLAEYALELVGWGPSKGVIPSLVDPTCGAGAFLVPALYRAVEHLVSAGLRNQALVERIGEAIRGYDINPLAVMATRLAFLVCLRNHLSPENLPPIAVYQRDVIEAPFGGSDGRTQAQFLVGNPPWLRWSEVPAEDRERVARAAKHFSLIPRNTFHGGSELDLSAVVSYAASAVDLTLGGSACFVLPRAHLQAPASSHFRRLKLPDSTTLGLQAIADFERLRVFRGAAVHPILMVWRKGGVRANPVPCLAWSGGQRVLSSEASWLEAKGQLVGKAQVVVSVEPEGRLSCLREEDAGLAVRLDGGSDWLRGRKGVTTDLNGAFFMQVLGLASRPGYLRVRNVSDRGKRVPSHEFEAEEELLFPLLKGAGQIQAFRVLPGERALLLPRSGKDNVLDEREFERRYPGVYSHFQWLEQESGGALAARATYRRMAGRKDPFYSVFNVGEYTFREFKVVWPEMTSCFRAAVVQREPLLPGGRAKVVVPDHKVYFAALESEPEADYVCAYLNAPCIRRFVEGATARLQIGALLHTLRIPRFRDANPAHVALAEAGHDARTQSPKEVSADLLDDLARRVILE